MNARPPRRGEPSGGVTDYRGVDMSNATLTENIATVARVLTAHHPNRADRGTCWCGRPWHPRHQAQELDKAGLLRS